MIADEFSPRYERWSRVLLEHLLLADAVDDAVLLTVTPRILSTAMADEGEEYLGPADAENDLVRTTRDAYHKLVLNRSAKLNVFRCRVRGVPASIPFLAVSVLAAYHMHTGNEYTGRAYYPRLAKLLEVDIVDPTYPRGFDGSSFESLWLDLSDWLRIKHGRRLGPPLNSDVRKYVAYPMAHAPLRKVDLDRLPRFFQSFGYEPGSRPPLDRLRYNLVTGHGSWTGFTPAGRRALEDESLRSFVVRQVAHELEQWDGYRKDSAGRRVASIEIMMEVYQRRAHISWLGRRPNGFPEYLVADDFVFESEEDCWYEPVPLESQDGRLLSKGLRVVSPDGNFALQRIGTRVIPLCASEEYTGYVSDRVLRYGSNCAVLCVDDLATRVADYLLSITGTKALARRDPTLPAGWCLFLNVTPKRAVDPPEDLEALRVESSIKIVPHGGLRLVGRWAWLQGVPPCLELIGRLDDQPIRINSREVQVDNGRIDAAWFVTPGQYVIEVGTRLRQKVNIIEPDIHPDCSEWPPSEVAAQIVVPSGVWIVLGESPGELLRLPRTDQAMLRSPPFKNSWAVSVGAGPGARVRHLHNVGGEDDFNSFRKSRLPSSKKQRRQWVQWAELIHQAAIRRPSIASNTEIQGLRLKNAWTTLVKHARFIKRMDRRAR